ncbi:MAG TPA: ABC transporter ATP-binding protein, partial [Coriobacteriia bacterium]
MLAVLEDLLDSWPGTLLLITHDRYLMERVTDDQFALVDGRIRHVPGGVDEYLRLLDRRITARAEAEPDKAKARDSATGPSGDGSDEGLTPVLSNAEERSLKKELASTERKLATLAKKADAVRIAMQEADPSDYVAIVDAQARLQSIEQQISDLEDEWLGLSERLS